jgi:hypothetical protein
LNSPQQPRKYHSSYRVGAGLLGLTAATILIHGYHVGVEDQGIYLPGILKDLSPSLFPHDAIFFEAQTRPTLIDETIAAVVRTTHLSVEWALLLFHLLTIFLILLGAWRVVRRCFPATGAAWGGLSLLTGLFLLPIAGTSQYIIDQYMHPRALATGLILLPVADLLPGQMRIRGWRLWLWCGFCFVTAFIFHLQIAIFGLGLLIFLAIPWERWIPFMRATSFALIPVGAIQHLFERGSPAWQEAARTRSQHYLVRWEWYEWLGIIAPMLIFWWWAKIADKHKLPVLAWFSRRLTLYGTIVLVVGSALILPPALERLTPTQPMRMFIFVYLYLLLLGGGLLGQFALRKVAWRWAVLFVPMAVGMYVADRELFPASPHVEWPGTTPNNSWVQAFLWIRQNTPNDAYFALNPRYYDDPGNNNRGFRAWARRSQLADWGKDAAVASILPELSLRWQREVHSLDGWEHLGSADFERLQRDFGVNWTILERNLPDGHPRQVPENLDCSYQNRDLYVCRIR